MILVSANATKGNMASTLADLIVVGMGSKLIKSAIYVTPEENAHPINKNIF